MDYQLYLITNLINGKQYVGQTQTDVGYQARFMQHWRSALYEAQQGRTSSILHHAMLKEGLENFKTELLVEHIPEDQIDYAEMEAIERYDTFYKNKKGYNMTFGGQGTHGYAQTEEGRKVMSQASKSRWAATKADPDLYASTCANMSTGAKGRAKTKEHRAHLSQAAKKRFENQPGTFKGRKHKESTKQILSELHSFPIGAYDVKTGELIKTFPQAASAVRWLIDEGKTSNKYAQARI